MIDAAAACRVLDQLEDAGLVVWLDGGWGVDALLGRPMGATDRHDLALLAGAFGVAVPPGVAEEPGGDQPSDFCW